MKIELNRHSQIPLAKQIYQELADRILSGQFAKGYRLRPCGNWHARSTSAR